MNKSKIPHWLQVILIFPAWFLTISILIMPFGYGLQYLDIPFETQIGDSLAVVFAMFFATILVVGLFLKYVSKTNWNYIGMSIKNRGKDIVFGIALGAVIMGLATLVFELTGWVEVDLTPIEPLDMLFAILLFVMVGFYEEVFSRGFVQGHLQASIGKWPGILIASFLFMALHLNNPNSDDILPIVNLFLAGIMLGINYTYTNNLWLPIALHFSWNFFQGPIFGFHVSGTESIIFMDQENRTSDWITGGDFGFEGSIFATIIIIVYIIASFIYHENKKDKFRNRIAG